MRRVAGALTVAALLLAPSASAFVWPNTAERVEKALESEDPAKRQQAALRLMELPRSTAQRLTPKALGDPDVQVRLIAAQVAVQIRLEGAGERVVPWLNDSERRIRLAAAEVLRVSRAPSAVGALGRVLGDPDPGVRRAAAVALGVSATRDAVMPLLGHLDDTSPDVRDAVVRALARLGDDRAVVPLIGKIQDSRPGVREAVARALGTLGNQRASSALVLALRDDTEEVRLAAVEALGRLRAESTVPTVAALLVDERRAPVRRAALRALAQIGTPGALDVLMGRLDAPDGGDRSAASNALADLGDAAMIRLRQCLVGQPSKQQANQCVRAIARIGPKDGAELVTGALRRGIATPRASLRALARLADPRGLATVLEHLQAPDPFVRSAAIEAASELLDPKLPDGRAVEPIARALEAARSTPAERISLVRLLGRTGSPRAATALAPLAGESDDAALRTAALDALGHLGPAGQDSVLLEALDADEPAVRLAAAVALRRGASPKSSVAILDRLSRAAEQDRGALAVALGGALGRDDRPAVLKTALGQVDTRRGGERDALLEAVGRMKIGSSELQKRARSAAEVADRAKVAEALGAHPSASDALVGLTKDVDGSVRANAVWSLGSVGDAGHLGVLEALLGDPDVAVSGNAAAALGRVGARTKKPVAPSLCRALDHARSYVRANALAALGVAGARCGDGAKARQMLEADPSSQVRQSAAALLRRVPSKQAEVDRVALQRCADEDPVGSVAVVCVEGRKPKRPEPEGTEPITVFVVPTGESSPVPRAPFALVRADGLMRLGLTDRRGAVYEHDAPAGEVRLAVPAPLAR